MRMKSFIVVGLIVVGLTLLLSLAGCGRASKEESIFRVQQLSDFKEIIQTMELSGPLYTSVTLDHASPEFHRPAQAENTMYSTKIILYKTKTDGFRVAILCSERPPRLNGLSEEFK